MRVQIDITLDLLLELNVYNMILSTEEAKQCYTDLGLLIGLRWVEIIENNRHLFIYDVIDEKKFFLSVMKYGIQFEEVK